MAELILFGIVGVIILSALAVVGIKKAARAEKDSDNAPKECEEDLSSLDQDEYYKNKAKMASEIEEVSKTHQKASNKQKEQKDDKTLDL